MADSGSINLDLGVNLGVTLDGAGLQELSNTIKEISKGKDLQRYWKDVESATDSASKAIERYSKNVNSKNLAENVLKQINALKALTKKENLSELFPNMELNLDGLVESAKKVAPQISSQFSVDSFSQAFKTFDLLKEKSIDLTEAFIKLANYADLIRRNSELDSENRKFRNLIGDSDVEEVKSKLSEIKRLRDQAEEIFTSFLKVNNIERTDYWGDEKFSDYFDAIRKGCLTATDAITRFKTEYSYLLEESFKSNNDTFGLEQLQLFSNKLDNIFHQVEETSNKINDIISSGVITKSIENLSVDNSLSDQQRSLFGNLLEDEESLKSITSLFQKLIEESNQTKNTELFNEEQFNRLLILFDKIESSLSSIKTVLVDVGDGEEFSPLLKMIDNVQSSVKELSTSVSGIKLDVNMDLGSEVNERLNQKVSQSLNRQLEAYRNFYSAMKATKKTNKEMFRFYEPDDASISEIIGAYKGVIKRAEDQYGKDIYKKLIGKDTYNSYVKEIKNATDQFNRATNKKNTENPLGDLFGKTDLTEVVSQLEQIVLKLDEISQTAGSFNDLFSNGLNVSTFIEEVEKLTNKVKELEDELAKIKITPIENGNKSNISREKIGQTASFAKELDKVLEQVNIPTESFDEVLSKLDLTKSKLTEIVKITRQARADKDGKFYESFTLTDKNGSHEIYGENSKTDRGQLLEAKYIEFDVKAKKQEAKSISAAHEEALKLNNALNKTQTLINGLSKHKELSSQFTETEKKVEELNSQLKNGDISLSEYNKSIKETVNDYSKLVDIQQKRDIESYNADVKAKKQEAKENSKIWNDNLNKIKEYLDAKTKLNNLKASNVGKDDTENIKRQEQEVEKLKIEAEEARATLSKLFSPYKQGKTPSDDWKEMMAIFRQATDGSEESVAKLNDSIKEFNTSELQSIQTYIDSAKKSLNETSASRDNSEKSSFFKKYEKQVEECINEIIAEKNRLESALESGDIEIIDKSDLTDVDDLKQKLTNLNLEYKTMFKGSADVSRWKEIDTITKYMEKNTRISKKAKIQFQGFIEELKTKGADANVEKIHQSFLEVCDVERKARREGQSFLDVLRDKVWYQWAAQIGTYFSFNDIMRYGKEGIQIVRELDTALTEMRKVSEESVQSLKNYQASTFDVADAVGTTAVQIQNSTADWMRLGESIDEASESARVANILLNVSEFDSISDATDSLVAMGQAYKDLDKIEIVDKLNEVGRRIIAQTYGNVWHILYMLYLGKSVKILGKDKTEILF